MRCEQLDDGWGQAAQREGWLEGRVRCVNRSLGHRTVAGGTGADANVGGREIRFVADLREIGGGRETGIAYGFKALNLVAQCAGEFAIDIKWTPAHAGDGAHVLHAWIGELAENQGFAGTQRVADDTRHLDVEGFWLSAAKDRPNLAALAGPEFIDGQRSEGGRGGENRGR